MRLSLWLFLFLIFTLDVKAATGDNCVFTQVDVAATTVSTQVLTKQSGRRCLIIQNQGASTVYLKFSSAHSAFEGFTLAANSKWEPTWIPVNAIYARTGAGSDTLTILEGR